MQGTTPPVTTQGSKRKLAFDGDIHQALKLTKSTINEILEPKPKFKYRANEYQSTMSAVSEDSWDPKPKKITPVEAPAPNDQKKG